jgi:threonine/homoserine/homoserine lactone efflux protein
VNAIESLVMSRTFAALLVASLVLALTPGPGVPYIVTRTLGHGHKAGLASVCGVALGNLANACAALVGPRSAK